MCFTQTLIESPTPESLAITRETDSTAPSLFLLQASAVR